jgi:hypothetical protein
MEAPGCICRSEAVEQRIADLVEHQCACKYNYKTRTAHAHRAAASTGAPLQNMRCSRPLNMPMPPANACSTSAKFVCSRPLNMPMPAANACAPCKRVRCTCHSRMQTHAPHPLQKLSVNKIPVHNIPNTRASYTRNVPPSMALSWPCSPRPVARVARCRTGSRTRPAILQLTDDVQHQHTHASGFIEASGPEMGEEGARLEG